MLPRWSPSPTLRAGCASSSWSGASTSRCSATCSGAATPPPRTTCSATSCSSCGAAWTTSPPAIPCPGRTASPGAAWAPRRSAARQERLVERIARERPAEPDDDRLAGALAALPEADRELLRLWAWEQLPPREIAVILGVSTNAAAIRLHRAKKRLRGLLVGRRDAHAAGHEGLREGGGAR